jgi:hypothetical protein
VQLLGQVVQVLTSLDSEQLNIELAEPETT